MHERFDYAAILEFDDVPGLLSYLEHPVHANLGDEFFRSFEVALMYDFDLKEGADAIREAAVR